MITHVTYFALFLEGIVSFLSPCILPLLPVYIAYILGTGHAPLQKRILQTSCFVLGVMSIYFVFALAFTTLGSLLSTYHTLLARIGGLCVFLFGLLQLGVLTFRPLQMERRFQVNKEREGTAFGAWTLGVIFSFGWSPCIGPALSSVLIMAGNASTRTQGIVMIFVYALGLLIPFAMIALFSTKVSEVFIKNKRSIRYIQYIGAVGLCVLGIFLFLNLGPFNTPSTGTDNIKQTEQATPSGQVAAPDLTLQTADGQTVTLSDYKGKKVFLNFWATWCGPCRRELPEINQLYHDYGENNKDVIVLTVVAPNQFGETSVEGIKKILKEENIDVPVLLDEDGSHFEKYAIESFPTTYLVQTDGTLRGKVSGALTNKMMHQVIDTTS